MQLTGKNCWTGKFGRANTDLKLYCSSLTNTPLFERTLLGLSPFRGWLQFTVNNSVFSIRRREKTKSDNLATCGCARDKKVNEISSTYI